MVVAHCSPQRVAEAVLVVVAHQAVGEVVHHRLEALAPSAAVGVALSSSVVAAVLQTPWVVGEGELNSLAGVEQLVETVACRLVEAVEGHPWTVVQGEERSLEVAHSVVPRSAVQVVVLLEVEVAPPWGQQAVGQLDAMAEVVQQQPGHRAGAVVELLLALLEGEGEHLLALGVEHQRALIKERDEQARSPSTVHGRVQRLLVVLLPSCQTQRRGGCSSSW